LTSPFPKPLGGAVIVTQSGKVLGRGRSDYRQDAVLAALKDAGLEVTPLSEWVVAWPHSKQLRDDLATATLYLTLEPSNERQGEALPPMTQLIQQSGIQRVVIGSANPVPELRTEGAATLHSAGIQVTMGIQEEDCSALIEQYADLANSKLQKSARKHFQRHGVVSNECTMHTHMCIRLGTMS
jgi:pyrimidine deaminase RibD-like protein